jgi:hypothetical protein
MRANVAETKLAERVQIDVTLLWEPNRKYGSTNLLGWSVRTWAHISGRFQGHLTENGLYLGNREEISMHNKDQYCLGHKGEAT